MLTGFEVILSTQQFVSEWLVELMPDNREKVIFDRDLTHKTYSFAKEFQADSLYDKLQVYADDIFDDRSVLMLSVLNKHKRGCIISSNKLRFLRKCNQWFDNSWISIFQTSRFLIILIWCKPKTLRRSAALFPLLEQALLIFNWLRFRWKKFLMKYRNQFAPSFLLILKRKLLRWTLIHIARNGEWSCVAVMISSHWNSIRKVKPLQNHSVFPWIKKNTVFFIGGIGWNDPNSWFARNTVVRGRKSVYRWWTRSLSASNFILSVC